MRRVKPSVWVALFFVALTAIGLFVTADYGLPVDEPAEQVILQENMMEYAYRLLGTGSAAVQYYDSLHIQRISQSIERDHGQSAYYLAAPLLALQKDAPDLLMTLWHQFTWLWFMLGVVALYILMRSLGLPRVLACATALTLYLSPRFFAEGHYNNKDVVLLSLVLCTLAAGVRFWAAPTYRRALMFSLAGALATNTKIVGALAWGLVGLGTLISLAARRQLTGRRLRIGLVAVLAFIGFYALLTPALWADPLGYFPYVLQNATGFTRWSGVVIFKGAVYDPTNGLLLPRSYLPTMVLITVPVCFLLLAAVGQAHACRLLARKDERWPMLCVLTLLWLLPVVYVMIARPLMYNGWRHFYFIYAGIAAMAGLGLQAIAAWLGTRITLKRLAAFALAGIFACQSVLLVLNHPYQYAYYNALAGNALNAYELDYWDVSTVNALRRLCQTVPATRAAPLQVSSRDAMSYFGLSHGYDVLSTDQRSQLTVTEDENAPYLFYNATYADIYSVAPPNGYSPLFSLSSYGRTLCTVYKRQ